MKEGAVELNERQRVGKYYDTVACSYDRRYEGIVGEYYKAVEDSYILGSIDFEGKKALDLGTGTGRFAFALAKEARHCIGIDLSRQMLSVAKRKLEKLGKGNVSFKAMDAAKTSFPGSSFDVVLSIGLFEYVKNLRPYLNEVGRILKPQGYFAFTVLNKEWLPKGLSRKGRAYDFAGHSLEKIEEELNSHGFEVSRFFATFFIPNRNRYLRKAESIGFGRILLTAFVGLDRLLNRLAFARKKAKEFVVIARKR